MSYNTAAIRDLLNEGLSEQDLTFLCYDHFRPVYDDVNSSGMGRLLKIHYLIEYCERQGRLDELLDRVRDKNPAKYDKFSSLVRSPAKVSISYWSGNKRQLEIEFAGDFSQFTSEQKSIAIAAAVTAIAIVLRIPLDQINLKQTRIGSLILQLEVPVEAIEQLIVLHKANDPFLHLLGIEQVKHLKEDFSPNLFVGRISELEELTRWATDPVVPRRLKSIAAPPGYGKSWLLYQLENRLASRSDVFVVRASPLELKSKEDIEQWLPSVVKKAQTMCAKVRDGVPGDLLESQISNLLEDLYESCHPPLTPILIVDGLDETLKNERRELEIHLLEQFWLDPRVRIIVSFRDEYSLTSPNLRRGEERLLLEPFSEDEGRRQLDKRSKLMEEQLRISQGELLKIVSPYALNIPGLNTILSKRIKQNEDYHRHPLLSADDLQECWHTLIGLALTRRAETPESLEEDLKRIVGHQEDTWTLETFANLCVYSEGTAHYHIQSLMALSVVSSAYRQRYQVVDGIREIIRAENRLRREKKA